MILNENNRWRRQKLNYLTSIEIFRDLSPADLKEMDRQFTMTTCGVGNIFYMPQESGEVLFLLKKGRVQLEDVAFKSIPAHLVSLLLNCQKISYGAGRKRPVAYRPWATCPSWPS